MVLKDNTIKENLLPQKLIDIFINERVLTLKILMVLALWDSNKEVMEMVVDSMENRMGMAIMAIKKC